MYCQKCGKEVQEGWKVCPNCGSVLDDRTDETVLKTDEAEKTKTSGEVNEKGFKKKPKEKSKKKPFFKKVWFWIVVVIVIFILICCSGTDEESEDTAEHTPSTEEQLFSTGQKSFIDKLDDAVNELTDGAFGSSEDVLTAKDDEGNVVIIESDADGNPIVDENGNYVVKGSRFICRLGYYGCVNEDYPSAGICLYSEDGETVKYAFYDSNLSSESIWDGTTSIYDRNILHITIEDYSIELIWSDEETMYVISKGKLGGTMADVIRDMTTDRDYILNEND